MARHAPLTLFGVLLALAAPTRALAEHPVPSRAVTFDGTLRASSPRGPNGGFAQPRRVAIEAGESVTVTMTSAVVDSLLVVESPRGGTKWVNDDLADDVRDARVAFVAPTTGRYTIVASSYAPGETGAYRVVVEETPPIHEAVTVDDPSIVVPAVVGDGSAAPDDEVPGKPPLEGSDDGDGSEVPPDGLTPPAMAIPPESGGPSTGTGAGPTGTGRVLGVFVGIDDYPDAPLEGDVTDARRVEQALRATGALAPADEALLTDRAATVNAVRSAIRRVGARVTANDVFVLFFSGHGSRGPGAHADGHDESIVMRDGDIPDGELAQLLAPIGGTQIVALDSCFAGGFAQDLAAPNRIGLFASTEDVESVTAPQYGAGGYLAYWLYEAIAGGAREGDGETHVADLVDYVAQQYAAHRDELDTTDAEGNPALEQLVVSMGVDPTEALWRAPDGSTATA